MGGKVKSKVNIEVVFINGFDKDIPYSTKNKQIDPTIITIIMHNCGIKPDQYNTDITIPNRNGNGKYEVEEEDKYL